MQRFLRQQYLHNNDYDDHIDNYCNAAEGEKGLQDGRVGALRGRRRLLFRGTMLYGWVNLPVSFAGLQQLPQRKGGGLHVV